MAQSARLSAGGTRTVSSANVSAMKEFCARSRLLAEMNPCSDIAG